MMHKKEKKDRNFEGFGQADTILPLCVRISCALRKEKVLELQIGLRKGITAVK